MGIESLTQPFMSSFGSGLGKALTGGDGPAVSSANGNTIDGAGFVVNFRGQQIASASPTSSLANPFPAASAGLGGGAALALLAVVGLVFWMRKRKG